MAGLIGKKVGMTSIFDENGKNIPCTIIEAGPCVVTQVKTIEKDGYSAIQIGYGEKKEKRTTQALKGHFEKANATPKKKLVEFREFDADNTKLGDILTVEYFNGEQWVDIAGTTKGKGFQGVVKRHGFSGVNDSTHGQHNRKRAPGSIGAASYPARVFKGLRMAGQTGNKRKKMMNLKVVKIVPEHNVIMVQGAVPGAKGSFVIIEK